MLVEEADELGARIRPAGVGVGPVRDAAGPAMSALVDSPAFGHGGPGGVLVAGAGVGMPAGNLPAAGHRGGRGARPAVGAARRQDVLDEARGVGGGHGRILVTVEDDQRQRSRRGPGRAGGPCLIAASAEGRSLAAA